jgi:hypothetical protein
MQKALEHQEHAHHVAEHGGKTAALLVAILAAFLAVCEQQAKHADIKVEANAILATDSWNQYQAKSIRQLMSQDLSALTGALDPSADPAFAQKRAALVKRFDDDAAKFQKDPKEGKDAIALRARNYEEVRDEALERAHSFDNAAAALELGIVLATASAITVSTMLIRFAMLMGALGVVLAILGWTAPSLGAF